MEDELSIRELIRMSVERCGYTCDCANDGNKAITLLDASHYDLLLLDIMLPKVNGYEILEYIQGQVPVIFITAKGTVQDRVRGLHLGADDYLVKPFSIDELLARIESVLRRYHKNSTQIEIINIQIDTSSRTILQQGKEIELTNMEYELLLYLVRNKNIALYRDVLYQKLWHNEEYDDTRTLDLHIQRLRKKLNWQTHIKTIYRIGYMLKVTI